MTVETLVGHRIEQCGPNGGGLLLVLVDAALVGLPEDPHAAIATAQLAMISAVTER